MRRASLEGLANESNEQLFLSLQSLLGDCCYKPRSIQNILAISDIQSRLIAIAKRMGNYFLGEEIIRRFNEVSTKRGFKTFLPENPARAE